MLEQAIIDAKELKESAQRNAEEAIVGIRDQLPVHETGNTCEDVLQHPSIGGKYSCSAAPFAPHIAEDKRLISGQNPASADGVGDAIVKKVAAR